MNYLSELTPAEILILTKENVTQQEILKITLIDLLFKNVLKIFEVERQAHIRQEVRVYKYVSTGENYNNYYSLNHERVFLSTFGMDNSIEILFRNLVKIGYQKSKTLSDLKNDIIKSPTLKKCFSQNIFQKLFYGYSFTRYGIELKEKVQKEIQNLGNELSSINNIDNQKAIELIKVIGANIFLLINVDYELLQQIDNDLGIEINKNNSIVGGSGCSGSSFDDYSSSFDSGCGGHSDCGGNSGCSGCGGCGGD
nr:hypothetical protein [uncultured Flavobacterium sp.]